MLVAANARQQVNGEILVQVLPWGTLSPVINTSPLRWLQPTQEKSQKPLHPCLLSESESVSCSVVSNSATLWTVAPRLLCPWDFPGKNTGVGCCFLLQGVFPTRGSNLGLLHCRQVLYHLNQFMPSSCPSNLTAPSSSRRFWGYLQL